MAAPKSLAAAEAKGPLSEMAFKTRRAGREGALRRAMGVSQGQKIPTARLRAAAARLSAQAKGEKKLSATELRRFRMIQSALRYRGE